MTYITPKQLPKLKIFLAVNPQIIWKQVHW